MRGSLTRLAEKGGPDRDEVLARIEPVDDMASATDVAPADLMIEAVVEDMAVKEDVFRRADAVLPSHAVLASNTSSLPIGTLAALTSRPVAGDRHALLQPGARPPARRGDPADVTSRPTTAGVVALARELGKEPVEARDVAGFAANRILMPFLNEAVHALAGGVASAEAIDTVAKLGFGHPMGPLALADLIGLDTCVAIMEVLERGLGDSRYAPAPLLREHVAAGRLGRKSGEGFFTYG